ncbi:MAG TPA: hypothetical protein H9922_05480 [Candidatus Phocaeicola caecigallinarum]|uniref:hypothetical protein n=1 Tax=Phocaeicola salanitronis TaxID=376805 RepID=UPI001C5C6F51|nr:hypothetical protein [Phocaeicola salanitronis]HJD10589.1 hypothetical protein [Candidatus Phocaeicola caecigallinarum]
MGNFAKQQEEHKEAKEREKLSRETLGKFFYDLGALGDFLVLFAQSTHENGYIKPRKTFWRNSKQLLSFLRERDRGKEDVGKYRHPFLLPAG